ncbi:MAG: MotA/TolQ/ExbB proton channel family protein [bacterium]|nr:MotA/TolQ/ExbB proton channel family protein [bacterium]
MIQILIKGGVLMIPILFCSIFALTIIIERSIVLYRARVVTRDFIERVKRVLKKDRRIEVISLCDATQSPLAKILKAGVLLLDKGKEEVKEAMEMAGRNAVLSLERNLNGLAIIAHISPLLGLLGTVVGMIRAFMEVERLGGAVNVSSLAGGIWEALITTASGLVVAIPAIIFYHYFVNKVSNFVNELEAHSQEFVNILLE